MSRTITGRRFVFVAYLGLIPLCHCNLFIDLSTLDIPLGDGGSGVAVPPAGYDAAIETSTGSSDAQGIGATDDGAGIDSATGEAGNPGIGADAGGQDAGNPAMGGDAGGSDTGSADAGGAADAPSGRDAEAGVRCASNVLVPTGAVSSSDYYTTTPASAAVDGNLSTRWDSLHADPQWIDLDFGAPVFVDRVQILWQHCATNYDLQVSNDASIWTTMTSIVGNTSGAELAPADWSGAVNTTGLAGVGRYLRVNASVRCLTGSGDSIWEMQVYGDKSTSCLP